MSGQLFFRNRQRTRRVDVALLRRITRALLTDYFHPQHFELCLHLTAAPEMSQVNQTFLRHAGATDVITFNHADPAQRDLIYGEIYICIDEAVAQARRFRTTWQSELVRYVVHGILHLHGYDDSRAAARCRMKREENRLLRALARRFCFASLAKKGRQNGAMTDS